MPGIKKISIYALMSIIAAAVGLLIYLNNKLPKLDGTVKAGNISSDVKVIRDKWGIPHISAENSYDAHFALGYTVAQDRLFQMELHRRLAKGELSEILGPSLLKIDKMFRTYLFRRTAEKYLSTPGKINPEALKILDAYIDGVNFFIESSSLPVEFGLIGIRPQKFTRLDFISMMGYMAYSFADGIHVDRLFSKLKKSHPNLNVKKLFPDYSLEKPVTIIESQAFWNKDSKTLLDNNASDISLNPIDLIKNKLIADYSKDSAMELVRGLGSFRGSNSWVIAPSRSASGRAIAANDPHMELSNPGVWYEVHIKYGNYENYGYHLPMFPFPLIAHNSHKAWTITMFENDDLDLYYEKFKDKDLKQVMYKGTWTDTKIINETIKVKGSPDEELKIVITPHGPVISDFFDDYKGDPVSLSWVFLNEENKFLDFAYEIANSKNVSEFRNAVSKLVSPGLNLSMADSRGNIAWFAAGKIVVRPPHVNSKEILDGASGLDENLGYLPFELNPNLVNPESGIIVTANNKSTVKPLGPVMDLEGYWVPTERAARITQLLSSKEKWSLEDLKKIQTDVTLISGAKIVSSIAEVLDKKTDSMTVLEKKAYEELKKWNYIYDVNSTGAAVFSFTAYQILKGAVADEMGDKEFDVYCGTQAYWSFFKALIADPGMKCWDDIRTNKIETRDDIVTMAFSAAVADLYDRFGGNIKSWSWGKIHKIEYVHPVGRVKPMNLIFNIGPYPAPGEANVINMIMSAFGKQDYRAYLVPSTRRLIDYADLSKSYSIQPNGNSGNFMSSNYSDQVKMYLNGEYRILNFTDSQISANQKHILIIIPEKTPVK